MYIYIYAYVYIYIYYIFVCICIYTYVYVYIHMYTYVYVYMHLFVCICASMYTPVLAFMHAHRHGQRADACTIIYVHMPVSTTVQHHMSCIRLTHTQRADLQYWSSALNESACCFQIRCTLYSEGMLCYPRLSTVFSPTMAPKRLAVC